MGNCVYVNNCGSNLKTSKLGRNASGKEFRHVPMDDNSSSVEELPCELILIVDAIGPSNCQGIKKAHELFQRLCAQENAEGKYLTKLYSFVRSHLLLQYCLGLKYTYESNTDTLPAIMFARTFIASYPYRGELWTNIARLSVEALCSQSDKYAFTFSAGSRMTLSQFHMENRKFLLHKLLVSEDVDWCLGQLRYFKDTLTPIHLASLCAHDAVNLLFERLTGFGTYTFKVICAKYSEDKTKSYWKGALVSLLTKINLNTVPKEDYEELLLDRDKTPTALWKDLCEIFELNSCSTFNIHRSDHVLSYLVALLPRLTVAKAVQCSFSLSGISISQQRPLDDRIKHWVSSGLHFIDPRTLNLQVRAQMRAKPEDIIKIVGKHSADAELQLQQAMTGVPGTKQCMLCRGTGEIDLDEGIKPDEITNLDQLSPAATEVERAQAQYDFVRALAKRDMQGVRTAIRRRQSLDVEEARCDAAWFYSQAWEHPASTLPYNGDMQKAMKARDRDAIKAIMKSRQTPRTIDTTTSWVKCEGKLTKLLECAYQDSPGTVVNLGSDPSLLLPSDQFEEGMCVVANLKQLIFIDQVSDRRRRLQRVEVELSQDQDTSGQGNVRVCFVCHGSGTTSRWLEESGFLTMDKAASPVDSVDTMCGICMSERGRYGMSVDCEHLFCNACLVASLEAILTSGQFPAHCTTCRAAVEGKQLHRGLITRPVLTFLQERGLFSKLFQFRFVTAMDRVGGGASTHGPHDHGEVVECPSGCGTFMVKEAPTYEIIDGKSYSRLASCPCGVNFCITCEQVCENVYHICKRKSKNMRLREREAQEAESELMAMVGTIGKACPVCKIFIQKHEGCQWMMCGCVSHGSLKDAIRNGGCGIAFDWNSVRVDDDPCGYTDVNGTSRRGRPITARQIVAKRGNWPKCARADCLYYKCTDGEKIIDVHTNKPSNGDQRGGDYCCSGCRDGQPHTAICHRCPLPSSDKAYIEAKLAAKHASFKEGLSTKWLVPFDAYALRLVWSKLHIAEGFKAGVNHVSTDLSVIGVDGDVIDLSGAISLNMVANISGRFVEQKHANLFKSSISRAARVGNSILELTFVGGMRRVTGIRARNLEMLPFKLWYFQQPLSLSALDRVDSDNIDTFDWIEYRGLTLSSSPRTPKNERIDTFSQGNSLQGAEILATANILGSIPPQVPPDDGPKDLVSPLLARKTVVRSLAMSVSSRVEEVSRRRNEHEEISMTDRLREKRALEIQQTSKGVMIPIDTSHEQDQSEISGGKYNSKIEEENEFEVAIKMRRMALFEEDCERKQILLALGDEAQQCPACGMVTVKAHGDDKMMCGCEGRAAGGNQAKALMGGGCGHEYDFKTGRSLNNITGMYGNPLNDRQWKFDEELNPQT